MRLGLAGLLLAGLLVGCGQANKAAPQSQTVAGEGYAAMGGVTTPARAAHEESQADADTNAPAPPPNDAVSASQPRPSNPNATVPSPIRYVAYSYQSTLEVPAARLIGVMDAHVRACQAAGPSVCQIISSNRVGDPESAMNGEVSLRAAPQWLSVFMAHLGHDADAAGGRVLSQATTSEDLTRSMVDTEATLRASKALRDRLQRLLESRPGRLSDLLDVERELARVQGEIDATESNLAVMRARVEMSTLTLSYQSSAQSVRSDTFRPLGDAFANFLSIVVTGFAAIIVIIAGMLPFAIVLIPIVWGLLAWRRRRGGRFFRRKEPGTTPTP